MATCETCGNDYDKAFQVTMNGKAHTYDSFECAIHGQLLLLRALRPRRGR